MGSIKRKSYLNLNSRCWKSLLLLTSFLQKTSFIHKSSLKFPLKNYEHVETNLMWCCDSESCKRCFKSPLRVQICSDIYLFWSQKSWRQTGKLEKIENNFWENLEIWFQTKSEKNPRPRPFRPFLRTKSSQRYFNNFKYMIPRSYISFLRGFQVFPLFWWWRWGLQVLWRRSYDTKSVYKCFIVV